jgi:protein arginine kinase
MTHSATGSQPMPSGSEPVGWMACTGPDADVVISSRVRLARNLVGYRFPHRADDGEREDVAAVVIEALRSDAGHAWRFVEPGPPRGESAALLRAAMARSSFGGRPGEVLAAADGGRDFALVNEEDHVRVHHIEPGLETGTCLEDTAAIAQHLGRNLNIAVHPELGYLAASPANCGAGLRVSVMLHVPGLAAGGRLDRLFRAAERLGMTARGVFGEGTRGLGHVYQVSNQGASRDDPERIETAVRAAAAEVVGAEREARSALTHEKADSIASAAEQGARFMRPGEWVGADVTVLLRAWSDVRLGRAMGLCEGPALTELTAILAEWGHRFGTRSGGSVLNTVRRGSGGGAA